MNIVLKGLGIANPPMYATQEEAYEFFSTQFDLTQDELDLYRRILLDGKIKGRYVGMDEKTEALETDPDALLARFLKFGRPTAVAAAQRALDDAGVKLDEDKPEAALDKLTGFIDQVNDKVAEGEIDQETANALIAAAQRIINAISRQYFIAADLFMSKRTRGKNKDR